MHIDRQIDCNRYQKLGGQITTRVCAGAERSSAEQPAKDCAPSEAAPSGEALDPDGAEDAVGGSGPDEEVVGNGSTEKAPAVRRRQVALSYGPQGRLKSAFVHHGVVLSKDQSCNRRL